MMSLPAISKTKFFEVHNGTNERDHGGRNFASTDEFKELENVVNEMRKSYSIKLNGLNSQVDILRKQVIDILSFLVVCFIFVFCYSI